MRWLLFSTRKAQGLTKRLLDSQRSYHHNHNYNYSHNHNHNRGASSSGSFFSHTPSSTTGSFLRQSFGNIAYLQPSSSFLSRGYATSAVPNSPKSLSRFNGVEKSENVTEKLDLQIISKESIKPASPTPDHLRPFSFSILDQFFFKCHTPLVLFLPNNDNATVTDVITKRSRHLKDSLSELLTRYYPFAGEIKDDLHIECNDKGVYFVEARVNQTLKEFLLQPDDHKVRELIAKHPSQTESSPENYIVSVQVNVFNCGGIALSTKLSHKIIDGTTSFMFLNAWAATARGSPEKITPDFAASKIFPNNPSLKYSLPSKLMTSKQTTSKRFVFDSTALSTLKNQIVVTTESSTTSSRGPTRMEATGALIWKAAAKAASTVRPFSPQSPHALLPFVNIRKQGLASLPKETIGNLFISAVGICLPYSQPDLTTLMTQIRESIAKINPELVEALKGEKGHQTVDWLLKMLNDLYDVMDEGDGLVVTSLLNSGIYGIDFGWGKPIWFYHVSPGSSRIVALNDMIKGGVEAIVTLSPEEMKIFEEDLEILSYTSVNPSPLQFLD